MTAQPSLEQTSSRVDPFQFGSLPAYLVRFVPETIKLDADPGKSAWNHAPWSSDFVWIDAGDNAPLQSRFKALYNREGLYFAFDYESVPKAATPLDPDLPDACEIFLDPTGRGRRYLEYAVAPDGTEHQMVWQGRLSIRKWLGKPGIISERIVRTVSSNIPGHNDRLLYQVFFPWKGMMNLTGKIPLPPVKGQAWRANFSRVEEGRFAGDYIWAPMGVYYMHHPGPFGWLIFSGETRPLEEIASLKLTPLRDDAYLIPESRVFPLFSRILWTRFPVIGDQASYYAVSKSFVIRLDSTGTSKWTKTRRDGLPQFIRSVAFAGGRLYVLGDGIHAGLAILDRNGVVSRAAPQENFHPGTVGKLSALSADRAVISKDNKFQCIHVCQFGPMTTTEGQIKCAVGGKKGQIVLGTTTGFEAYDPEGKFLGRWAIAGGISSAVSLGESVIGASGKDGLFQLTDDGKCDFYPRPLRSKFDGVFSDGLGGCWASFTGGLVHINGNRLDTFQEPLGITGMKVEQAAAAGDGRMVFVGSVPNGDWYGSRPLSSFLLTYNGKKWRKWDLEKSLPGMVNAIAYLNGKILLSTNAGLFYFAS